MFSFLFNLYLLYLILCSTVSGQISRVVLHSMLRPTSGVYTLQSYEQDRWKDVQYFVTNIHQCPSSNMCTVIRLVWLVRGSTSQTFFACEMGESLSMASNHKNLKISFLVQPLEHRSRRCFETYLSSFVRRHPIILWCFWLMIASFFVSKLSRRFRDLSRQFGSCNIPTVSIFVEIWYGKCIFLWTSF